MPLCGGVRGKGKIFDMKILVTGAAGFIGSKLAESLIEDGQEVLVIDNLSTGKKDRVPAGARFVESCASSPEIIDAIFEFNADAIAHCGGAKQR